ncbi:TetR/AcrR family transcriptional regulator [Streptomyces pinistramenti]|uniref:TetR/AcrR family transcriptional regulator n=1 Tax=Streptomyces pinistramenti TaxID=2884812 RepID=UPI001D06DA22|nr:TetR/AcrR family transcriptional regulator [Streptomyces pinistramenti]MCB5911543.1 TetR/AcrR family transcriptional regulator [Streptomyces pinistramenti]
MTPAPHLPGKARPGGRTARTRQAVLTAVFDELAESGFGAVTMEGIAQRSGIHLATVYRRWRTIEGLVCDLLTDVSSTSVPLADTGTLLGDLHALAQSLETLYEAARVRGLLDAVVSAAARQPEAATILRDFFDGRLQLAGAMVGRAIARGEVPADTDPVAVISALAAPFYYRLLIVRRPVDIALAESTATAVWAGIRAGAYRTGGG